MMTRLSAILEIPSFFLLRMVVCSFGQTPHSAECRKTYPSTSILSRNVQRKDEYLRCELDVFTQFVLLKSWLITKTLIAEKVFANRARAAAATGDKQCAPSELSAVRIAAQETAATTGVCRPSKSSVRMRTSIPNSAESFASEKSSAAVPKIGGFLRDEDAGSCTSESMGGEVCVDDDPQT